MLAAQGEEVRAAEVAVAQGVGVGAGEAAAAKEVGAREAGPAVGARAG
jgi:hypothetical protein